MPFNRISRRQQLRRAFDATIRRSAHMSSKFNVGDTVQLRSGGPIMTVTGMGDHLGVLSAWCDWFIAKKKESDVFPLDALKSVDYPRPVQVARPRSSWLDARRGR